MGNALFGSSSRKSKPLAPDMALRVQTSIVGQAIPVGWGQFRIACNLLDYQDFKATAVKAQSAGGKGAAFGGGKGTSGSSSYTYSAAVVAGICEGPINSYIQCWNSKTKQTLASLGFTTFLGSYAQTAWSYMSSAHPANAINYRGIAYVAAGPLQLGSSSQLPNLNFEIKATFSDAISGLPDADPKDVTTDILTNVNYGVGFPSGSLSALTTWSQYCRATGMVISPVLTQQRSCADFLNEVAEATNSNFRWSGSTLDCIPYGDTTITAHGSTYTAPSAPQYDIIDADYICQPGDKPVKVRRARPSDQFNLVRTKYQDRNNDYNEITVQASDEAAVAQFGLRTEDPKSHPFICDAAAAQMSCSLRLGRQQVRNTYVFTVGRRFIRLDPMDIVSINDSHLGLVAQWVRINEITENSDNTLTISAEEYLNGTGAAPAYPRQGNTGHVEDYHAAPGSINTPLIFTAPMQLATNQSLEVWMAVSGIDQVNWGGCDVYMSFDNTTYQNIGRITGNSRQGVLTSTFSANGTSPDTTDTAHIDFTMSSGSLTSVSTTVANNYGSLMYVEDTSGGTRELFSYKDATLTSTFHYDLTTNYRGLYGTSNQSHASSSKVCRCDGQLFKLPYTKDRVGVTIYLKFCSFNRWGDNTQDLSSATAYTYVLTGPPAVYGPSNLQAFGDVHAAKLTWDNAFNVGPQATEIWRSTSDPFVVSERWHFESPGGEAIYSTPVVVTNFMKSGVGQGPCVIFTDYDWFCRVLKITDGSLVWSKAAGASCYGRAQCLILQGETNHTVCFPSHDGKVWVQDSTGANRYQILNMYDRIGTNLTPVARSVNNAVKFTGAAFHPDAWVRDHTVFSNNAYVQIVSGTGSGATLYQVKQVNPADHDEVQLNTTAFPTVDGTSRCTFIPRFSSDTFCQHAGTTVVDGGVDYLVTCWFDNSVTKTNLSTGVVTAYFCALENNEAWPLIGDVGLGHNSVVFGSIDKKVRCLALSTMALEWSHTFPQGIDAALDMAMIDGSTLAIAVNGRRSGDATAGKCTYLKAVDGTLLYASADMQGDMDSRPLLIAQGDGTYRTFVVGDAGLPTYLDTHANTVWQHTRGTVFNSSPVAYDVDGDTIPDIICCDMSGNICVYSQAGTLMKVFPANSGVEGTPFIGTPLANGKVQLLVPSIGDGGVTTKGRMTCYEFTVTSSNFGSAVKVGEAAAWATAYVDANLPSSTSYWYWIRYRDDAGSFSLYNPPTTGDGAAATTLLVQTNDLADNLITSPKVANANIVTSHLISNAATLHADVEATGPTTGVVATWITLVTTPTFTSEGGPNSLVGGFFVHNTDNGSHNWDVRIRRNGTTVVYPGTSVSVTTLNTTYSKITVEWVEVPGIGSLYYELQWKADSTALQTINMVLSDDEIKR